MPPLLKTIQKERTDMEKEIAINREELAEQKQRVEEKIKRAERKHIDDKILDSLRKLDDITDAVSNLQNSINLVWKRTKQVEEELKEALVIPSSLSHPETYPQG